MFRSKTWWQTATDEAGFKLATSQSLADLLHRLSCSHWLEAELEKKTKNKKHLCFKSKQRSKSQTGFGHAHLPQGGQWEVSSQLAWLSGRYATTRNTPPPFRHTSTLCAQEMSKQEVEPSNVLLGGHVETRRRGRRKERSVNAGFLFFYLKNILMHH